MTTTIRTGEARELLALIPYQLGFRPADSVVGVSLRGDRGRVGLVARMDLADLAHPLAGAAAAEALVEHLVADGAVSALLVLYADDAARAARAAWRLALARLRAAADGRIAQVEAWVVGPGGYFGADCADASCCPPGGRPLADLEGTRIGAQMVLDGVPVAASREELARVAPTDAAARKAARRARARWRRRVECGESAAALHRWRRDGLTLWRRLAAEADGAYEVIVATDGDAALRGRCPWSPGPAATDVGRLLAALDDVLVRDAVLLSCVPGAERVADRVLAGDRGADVESALGAIVDPVAGRRPDRRRVAAARAVLEHAAGHAGRAGHAPSLTLLALLAWWEGDGARAGVYAERALDADPAHRMANLIEEALVTGMPPGWLGGRRSA